MRDMSATITTRAPAAIKLYSIFFVLSQIRGPFLQPPDISRKSAIPVICRCKSSESSENIEVLEDLSNSVILFINYIICFLEMYNVKEKNFSKIYIIKSQKNSKI